MRLSIATGLVAVALLSTPVSPTQACSCIGTSALLWPAPGSSGIPIRPSIVVQRPVASASIFLRDTSGREVELASQGIGAMLGLGDCGGELVFLRPVSDLTANTQYSVVFRYPSESLHARVDPPPALFTTGTLQENPAPVPPLGPTDLRFFRVIADDSCRIQRAPCGEFVQVVTTSPVATEPAWLRLTVSGNGRAEQTVNVMGAPAGQLVPIDPGEECVRYEQVNVRGEIVATGSSCTRDKCVRVTRPAAGSYFGCTGALELPVRVFDDVDDKSCADPPLLVQKEEFGPFELVQASEPDAGSKDAGVEAQDGDGASPAAAAAPVSASPSESEGDTETEQVAANDLSHSRARCSLASAPGSDPAPLHGLHAAFNVLGIGLLGRRMAARPRRTLPRDPRN